jgi:HPr kinase/phosphorylase
MHGVFMDVLGMGVLIAGESGPRQERTRAGTDQPRPRPGGRRRGRLCPHRPTAIEGHCPPLLANLLEVRGLGLLDIKSIFGETAVRRKMKLRLIVDLRAGDDGARWSACRWPAPRGHARPADAQGGDRGRAGRNLAVLLEAAVRNTILQLRGIDTMAEFVQRACPRALAQGATTTSNPRGARPCSST